MKTLKRALLAGGVPLLFSVFGAANEIEYQLDAYYTSVDYYVNLTQSPIPYHEFKSETDIYKKLILSSPIPRFLLLETSVNPLPLLGVYLKRQARDFYDDTQFSEDSNLIRSITTGFEEPAAVSLFFGNIVDFKPVKKRDYAEGRGHIGYLVSAGNYHIKDNDMMKDDWVETEWKVKGDRIYPDMELRWSFRIGAKFHARKEITDVYYLGVRRSRIHFKERGFSWLNNSGIMYKFDFDQSRLSAVQHHFVVDKKFPLPDKKVVPSLALGFLWRSEKKYTGDLGDARRTVFQFLFQPNIEF
ncbi:MAG TPA: hypothetical protein P5079_01675 [Elusimicrobiota bacterium]|nr:hypothetical protein [Elusimicrobiota bacterium]